LFGKIPTGAWPRKEKLARKKLAQRDEYPAMNGFDCHRENGWNVFWVAFFRLGGSCWKKGTKGEKDGVKGVQRFQKKTTRPVGVQTSCFLHERWFVTKGSTKR